MPTSPVNVVFKCLSNPEVDIFKADWVVIVMVESAITGLPSFSQEMVGSGYPLTKQNNVAELLTVSLTDTVDAKILGVTVCIKKHYQMFDSNSLTMYIQYS